MGYPIWNRRRFLKTAAGTAGFLAAMPCLNAAEVFTDTKPLKVGLVGCGGRGLGAMKNALDADPGTMVLALAGDSTITKFSCITFSIFSLTQDNLSSYLGYPQVLRYFIIV